MSINSYNKAVTKVTPECENAGNSVSLMGIVLIVMIVIALILVGIMITYQNMDRVDGTADVDLIAEYAKRDKYVKNLAIGTMVVLILTGLIGGWNVMVGGKVKKCVANAKAAATNGST